MAGPVVPWQSRVPVAGVALHTHRHCGLAVVRAGIIRRYAIWTSVSHTLLMDARRRRTWALPAGADSSGDSNDVEAARRRLTDALVASEARPITGQELWDTVKSKFGASFDVRLVRRGYQMYLHVMWRYLEQQSFPLTPDEYLMQLDAVAEYLNSWVCQDKVRREIMAAKKGPGIGPGGARAVQIRLDVDFGNAGEGRSKEWT